MKTTLQTNKLSRLLARELEARMSKNSHYSLRAFARDLQIDASHLSAILKGKRGLDPSRTAELAHALKLNLSETEVLKLTLERDYSRNSGTRKAASERLKQISLEGESHPASEITSLSLDQYQQVCEWYSTAILEYLRQPKAKQSTAILARVFSITPHQVSESLTRMERLGLIMKKGARYQVVVGRVASTNGVPSEALRNFHTQMLEKAKQAIHFQSLEQRHLRSTTLLIRQESLPEVKDYLTLVWQELTRRFVDNEKGDAVYNVGFQIFELGKIETKTNPNPTEVKTSRIRKTTHVN